MTPLVVTTNVAVEEPCGTSTVGGTTAAELLLDSATNAPPAPAGLLRVTVPVEDAPPVTEVGFRVKETSDPEVIVNVDVCDVPPNAAVITADVSTVTPVVLT